MNIFSTLPAGDSTSWQDAPVRLADGRTADATAWTLAYHLRGAEAVDLTAAASGASWKTTLPSNVSVTLAPGPYAWVAVLTNAAQERITVGNGQLTITPDLVATTSGYDPLSFAQRALQNCEAAMATFNTTGGKVKKYTIAGREMEFQDIASLLALREFWKGKVMADSTASSIAQGQGNPRKLYQRFGNPN